MPKLKAGTIKPTSAEDAAITAAAMADPDAMPLTDAQWQQVNAGAPWPDKQRFVSVWDALENTPQQAARMKARSALMMALAEASRERGMTQAEAAALFGVTQPRVSDLVRGKVNLFSVGTLIDMAATAGMTPMAKVSKPKIPAATKPALRRKCRAAVELVAA